ncbi:MAG: ABC transporter substrate-binding protein [Actinomycetes bacterium]|jgi:iron complex transport system substrate-binding protein
MLKKYVVFIALPTMAISAALTPLAHATVAPHKIISLSPSATEDLFAIGAGTQVIAVDQLSNFPSSAPASKLDAFSPNVEAIAAYKPDLVILNSGATKAESVRSALKKLRIKVYFETAPLDMTGAYKEITELGSLTGKGPQAQTLIRSMKSAVKKAIETGRKKSPISIYHELDDTLYSVTSETFIGRVYRDFNLVNVADAAAKADSYGYPQLTPEYVVQSNPSIIYLSDAQYGTNLASVTARPGWSSLKAVTSNHVVALPEDIPSRWGPRLVDFYQFVSKSIAGIN